MSKDIFEVMDELFTEKPAEPETPPSISAEDIDAIANRVIEKLTETENNANNE